MVCSPSFSHHIKDLSSGDESLDRGCNAPAAILEFFEIASEAWFLCMAVDLAITLLNPFSPFRKRLSFYFSILLIFIRIFFYHLFSWGLAGFLATLVSIIPNVAGLWVINSNIAASYLCWLKSDSSADSESAWFFLYLPIIFIYSYALYVLHHAQIILMKGIPVTFLHRVRTLKSSQNMLKIFSLYYAYVVVLGILTSTVNAFWTAL